MALMVKFWLQIAYLVLLLKHISISNSDYCCLTLQVIELQLPSFFDNFDPRAAAANFPSSNQN